MTIPVGFAIVATLATGLAASAGEAPLAPPQTAAERLASARNLEHRGDPAAAAAAWESIAGDLPPGSADRLAALEAAGRVRRDRLHQPLDALAWWEAAWTERRRLGRLGEPDASYPAWVLGSSYEASERWADAERVARERLQAIGDAHASDRQVAAERLAGLIRRQRPDDPELFALAELAVASAGDGQALASALADRARLRRAGGRIEEALADLERAVALDGDDSWLLAVWSDALVAAGRLGDAAAAAERGLAVEEARLGPHHPQLHWELGQLVDVYAVAGRWDDARTVLARALEIAERAHGPQSETATRTRDAQRELARRASSDEPPSTEPLLGCRCTCEPVEPDDAALRLAAGDVAGAQQLLDERVRAAEEEHGADSEQVAAALEGLASRFERLDPRVAVAARERRWSILVRRDGPDHLAVLRAAEQLGSSWNQLGDHARSETYRQAAVDGWLAAKWPTAELATALGRLAESRERAGRHEEGLALRSRAVEVGRRAFGSASPEHREHRTALAGALAKAERTAEAIELLRELEAELARSTDREARWDRLIVVDTLRPLLTSLGRTAEAEELATIREALLARAD